MGGLELVEMLGKGLASEGRVKDIEVPKRVKKEESDAPRDRNEASKDDKTDLNGSLSDKTREKDDDNTIRDVIFEKDQNGALKDDKTDQSGSCRP